MPPSKQLASMQCSVERGDSCHRCEQLCWQGRCLFCDPVVLELSTLAPELGPRALCSRVNVTTRTVPWSTDLTFGLFAHTTGPDGNVVSAPNQVVDRDGIDDQLDVPHLLVHWTACQGRQALTRKY